LATTKNLEIEKIRIHDGFLKPLIVGKKTDVLTRAKNASIIPE